MSWLLIAGSFLGGVLLGVFFFGGLWWTVQKVARSDSPYLFTVISFIIRAAVVLAGFYLLLAAGWPNLLAAMAGFIIARTVLAYRLKPAKK